MVQMQTTAIILAYFQFDSRHFVKFENRWLIKQFLIRILHVTYCFLYVGLLVTWELLLDLPVPRKKETWTTIIARQNYSNCDFESCSMFHIFSGLNFCPAVSAPCIPFLHKNYVYLRYIIQSSSRKFTINDSFWNLLLSFRMKAADKNKIKIKFHN